MLIAGFMYILSYLDGEANNEANKIPFLRNPDIMAFFTSDALTDTARLREILGFKCFSCFAVDWFATS